MADQNGSRTPEDFLADLMPPIFPWDDEQLDRDPDLAGVLAAFTAEYVDFTLEIGAFLGTRLAALGMETDGLDHAFVIAAASIAPDLMDRQRELMEEWEKMNQEERRR